MRPKSVPFGDCEILTDHRALVPRPETEILFEEAAIKPGRILDLCCGSGAIGIAVKKRYPGCDVTLSDISPDALSLARENAAHNGVLVTFLEGDLKMEGPYDTVFCNPPYIATAVYETLDLYCPRLALDAGPRGTEIYERLAKELLPHLAPGAKVFFEIGYDQREAVLTLFPGAICTKDWAGHDRFIAFEFSNKV